MTTLSVVAGTTPPTHVVVAVQLPVCAEVIVAALAVLLKTTQRTASVVHANRTERNFLDSSFTLSYQSFF
jgi:Na+-transporting NADH:ubiquinone oxidoreductase subunit NqrC